jgi:hypothetical protein
MLNNLVKLNIKVDLSELRRYYSDVEQKYQHLCWKVGNTTVVDDAGVGGHRVEKMYGWAIESNALDITKPCPPYNIGLEKLDYYRDTDLVFGIIHSFKKHFPFAHGYSLATHPPGTFINSHIDTDDWIKIHVPIHTSDNSWFYFENDEKYHMEADGSLYLVNTMIPHGTDHCGTSNRAHLIFKIPFDHNELVQKMEGIIV